MLFDVIIAVAKQSPSLKDVGLSFVRSCASSKPQVQSLPAMILLPSTNICM